MEKIYVHGEVFFLLKDVAKELRVKSYVPARILKNILKGDIKRVQINNVKGKKTNRKYLCVRKEAANKLLDKCKGGMLPLTERIKIAREYGVSEGFITAHLYAGDLQKQLEYLEANREKRNFSKSYDCKGFMAMSVI